MRHFTLINLVVLLVLSVGCRSSHSSPKVAGRVLRFGIYETPGEPVRVPIAAAPTGHGRLLSQAPVFIREAARIPAKLGVRFGFDFEITGLPAVPVELRAVAIYPPIQRPDGSIGTSHEFTYPPFSPVRGRFATSFGFGFDKDYELVPGRWTMQIWRDNQMMVEKTFEVYRP